MGCFFQSVNGDSSTAECTDPTRTLHGPTAEMLDATILTVTSRRLACDAAYIDPPIRSKWGDAHTIYLLYLQSTRRGRRRWSAALSLSHAVACSHSARRPRGTYAAPHPMNIPRTSHGTMARPYSQHRSRLRPPASVCGVVRRSRSPTRDGPMATAPSINQRCGSRLSLSQAAA